MGIQRVAVEVAGTTGKLRLLRSLLLDSIPQIRHLSRIPSGLRYREERTESFADAASFLGRGFGDCADADILAGAWLEGRGVSCFPVVANFAKADGARRLHAQLWIPSRGILWDPTLWVFRGFESRPYRRGWPPWPHQRAALQQQLGAVFGL